MLDYNEEITASTVDDRVVTGLEKQMEELRSLIERMAIGFNAQEVPQSVDDHDIDTEEAERRLEVVYQENQKLRYQLDHLKANYLKLLAYRDSLCDHPHPSTATSSV
ncbi:hypothetical protein BDF19DRAFT_436937 [Syncephalis fuscata]|nr:hypothetical protein BDF19DRAFT_436937 [Syncephalis fuscata]